MDRYLHGLKPQPQLLQALKEFSLKTMYEWWKSPCSSDKFWAKMDLFFSFLKSMVCFSKLATHEITLKIVWLE